jgi:peptidyl-prolyl cis-trans isomerase SurA
VQRTAAEDASPKIVRRGTGRRDGRILRASIQKTSGDGQELAIPATWHQASLTAAQVGDEIITVRELIAAVSEQCKRRQTSLKSLSKEDQNTLAGIVLKRMIEQSLLTQEAKHTIKNPKMYDQFAQEADRYWREDQVPQLEIEYHADNDLQLRDRLKEHGRSFDTVAQMARQNWMAENFLHAKIKDRIKVDLPELRKYYEAHKLDKPFDRPAQIVWREIVVEAGRYPRREDARRKIEALHQSLGRGADFAGLARTQSDGPTRSREQGGRMQTSPGTYGVPSVNQALQSLPIGQISGILEGPTSFHIVRVEQRRAAGPAPFSELQDQIRSTLLEQKYQAERSAYLQKLWDQTPVSTIFDETQSDPRRFTN